RGDAGVAAVDDAHAGRGGGGGDPGRGDRRIALIDAAAEADLLVEPPAAHLDAGLAQRREGVAREAEFVRVHVGGDEVRRAVQQVVRDRDQQQSGVDEEDIAAGDAGRRPPDPRVLDDGAAGEVPELAEVRVV